MTDKTHSGIVFSISEASLHDGPGLRTAVFLKGCPLRCRWCHSPEGQSPEPEYLHSPAGDRISGIAWTADDLSGYLIENCKLCSNGGVTFSGGEPMMQAEFLIRLLEKLQGVHTIVETSGFCGEREWIRMIKLCSRIHFGLKIIDPVRSRFWIGAGSEVILRNLRILDETESGADYIFRIPLIVGAVDTEANMRDLMYLCLGLKRLKAIEFLPANLLAPAKYKACGRIFDPLCADCRTGMVPEWFSPGVPWSIER